MNYRIKNEFKNKPFPIMFRGQRIVVTSDNLNDERAQLLLSIPKWAHVLEAVNGVPVTVPSLIKPVKQEKDKVIPPNFIKPETEKESSLPNESTGSTSTSKEVKKEEAPVKKRMGRPPLKSKG